MSERDEIARASVSLDGDTLHMSSKAYAVLQAALARAEKAERERDNERTRRRMFEAAVGLLERERDEAREELSVAYEGSAQWEEQALKAERERDEQRVLTVAAAQAQLKAEQERDKLLMAGADWAKRATRAEQNMAEIVAERDEARAAFRVITKKYSLNGSISKWAELEHDDA